MSARGIRSARFLAAGTSIRIVVLPAIMGLILLGEDDSAEAAGAVLFAIAALTDFVDGYLARRWRLTTTLGSFLDTTADKLLVSGTLIALVGVERVSPWLAALIVGRELVILGLRAAVAADGIVVQPSQLGKLKASIQFLAILVAIVRPGDPIAGAYLDEWLMVVATAVTVVSGVEYVVRFASSLKA
jgi:CDP-diacylglycerol--glycerol-3-phosphate 3-phosphatidyltransferase